MKHALRFVSIRGLALFLSTLIVLAGFSFSPSKAYADTLGTITQVAGTGLRGKTVEGSDGRIWFASNVRGDIKAINKDGTSLTNYTFDTTSSYYVKDLTRGSDGNVWFLFGNKLARITPSGAISTYIVPSSLGDPERIISDMKGNIRIASLYGSTSYSYYLTTFSTQGSLLSSATLSKQALGLANAPNGDGLWILSGDSNASYTQILLIHISDDDTMTTSYTGEYGYPYGISANSDDSIWFSVFNYSNGSSETFRKSSSNSYTLVHSFTTAVYNFSETPDGFIWASAPSSNLIYRIPLSAISSTPINIYSTASSSGSTPAGLSYASDGNIWFAEVSAGRLSRIGTGISSVSTDSDGDGLTGQQEILQGTSDYDTDSDNDGLSDFVESTSNPNRSSLFCNSSTSYCEYPSPTQRDIYVETDWMYKPSPYNYSMQLSSTQVNSIKNAYAAKGIIAHIDTGQLGGGNQVPYRSQLAFHQVSGVPDFYDYKYGGDGVSQNFDTNRLQVYHYVLLVDQYPDLNGTFHTGGSYPGDDDTIIGYGELKDYSSSLYTSFDTALSGTIFHELGHTLCLTDDPSNAAYPSQPASCRYAGIDTYYGSSYPSSMNYDYQLSMVDYSLGSGHDDWSALRLSDFALQNNTGDPGWGLISASKRKNIKRVNTKPIVGPSVKDLKARKALHK